MSQWHAFIEDDEEGNVVIYLQNGDDSSSREVHEMVEHDVIGALAGQETAYLEEAENIAQERNADDELDQA